MSSDVEKIKDKLDIVDVISSYIKLEKSGINYKGKCPFHNEKTPSFFVSQERQSFYCFGCQSKGDIFSFVEKFEGVDFKGALEILADKAGIKLSRKVELGSDKKDIKEPLLKAMEEATKLYEKNLSSNNEALEYLIKRGLLKNTVTRWRIGFAKNEWRDTLENLEKKGFSKEILIEAGLIKKHTESQKYYDTFRDRVMFPIYDNAGRVIAFSGRSLKENDKQPKYLNSPETPIFHKSEVLYGFHLAKNHIRKQDYAVLVEGQMDILMSSQAGVLNTVASSGTALTEDHLKKIQKISNKIIIGYDSDEAGEKASKRAAELAIKIGMETKIATLEKGEDPASIILKDPLIWKKSLKEARFFIDYLIEKALTKETPEKITKEIENNVLPYISILQSNMEKAQYIKKISLKTGINEEAIWKDLEKIKVEENGYEKYQDILTNKKDGLEELLAEILFFEETKKNEKNNFKDNIEKIFGPDYTDFILKKYSENKESMIFKFEIQNLSENNFEKIKQDILKRLEAEHYKKRLKEITFMLDDKNLNKLEEEKIKQEIKKIQANIKDL